MWRVYQRTEESSCVLATLSYDVHFTPSLDERILDMAVNSSTLAGEHTTHMLRYDIEGASIFG
jgi:hypothetical protein